MITKDVQKKSIVKNLDVDDGFTFLFIITNLMIIIDGDDDIGRKVDMRSAERGSC